MLIRRGSRGLHVGTMQKKLDSIGYVIAIDNSCGPNMVKVIKAFQADNGLKVDGYAGSRTQAKLLITKHMKYQEFWLNKQTQVVKINRSLLTAEIIDVKTMSVKNLWRKLTKKSMILINGGLFDMKTMVDLNHMIIDGEKVGVGYYDEMGLKIDYNKNVSFGTYDNSSYSFIGGSPTLLHRSNVVENFVHLDNSFINHKHPRLAIGGNKKYIYIVIVNGRNKWRKWFGCTLGELTSILQLLECTEGMNLDGGGSISVVRKIGTMLKIGYRRVANMVAFYVKGR